MATAETGNGAVLSADNGWLRAMSPRDSRFIAEIFDGADEALAALEAVENDLLSTGFQTLGWLTVLYEELAPFRNAVPRLVVVTERKSGKVALVLRWSLREKGTSGSRASPTSASRTTVGQSSGLHRSKTAVRSAERGVPPATRCAIST